MCVRWEIHRCSHFSPQPHMNIPTRGKWSIIYPPPTTQQYNSTSHLFHVNNVAPIVLRRRPSRTCRNSPTRYCAMSGKAKVMEEFVEGKWIWWWMGPDWWLKREQGRKRFHNLSFLLPFFVDYTAACSCSSISESTVIPVCNPPAAPERNKVQFKL